MANPLRLICPVVHGSVREDPLVVRTAVAIPHLPLTTATNSEGALPHSGMNMGQDTTTIIVGLPLRTIAGGEDILLPIIVMEEGFLLVAGNVTEV